LASKNKTTITTHTQDTITQQELMDLAICQGQLAKFAASCQSREGEIARKRLANAVVEPGRFFLADTQVANAVVEPGRFFLAGTQVVEVQG
jgi:hypothetical protein